MIDSSTATVIAIACLMCALALCLTIERAISRSFEARSAAYISTLITFAVAFLTTLLVTTYLL